MKPYMKGWALNVDKIEILEAYGQDVAMLRAKNQSCRQTHDDTPSDWIEANFPSPSNVVRERLEN